MGVLAGLPALAGALGDLLFSLPVPVLVVLLFVVLFLTFGSSSSSTASEKLDATIAKQASPDQTDPAVSFCRSLGAPDHPHEEASFVPASEFILGNTTPVEFHNEYADGKMLSLHRATYDNDLNQSGDYTYGSYFCGKKRLWECRVQFRWKKPPRPSDLYFGIELEEYVPMNRATKRTMETLVSMLKRVVGNQIYHSPGDDPQVVTSGEVERPAFVMPLWAFDQYIVTPEGQEAPCLSDPAIPSMGSTRVKRVRKFREELDKLEFRVGPTYTFCFWGISQWLDKLNWEIKMPFMRPLDFNLFCGKPPVHVVIYSLQPQGGQDPDKKQRHLQSVKQYYFDTAFWSSKHRPSLERIQALLENTEQVDSPVNNVEGKAPASTLARTPPKQGAGRAWFACCAGR
mmetsp:Transcript_130706/g.317466  ORF Transcript_130706/g.317466 Transcript_130706/m.317466 type:complete len:400 (-) Transcript_130706:397-1596(-)